MTILDQIKSNEITSLHLSNDPEDYFDETKVLITALESNTSLEEIIFDKDFIACVYGNERGHLLEQIAKLPNLKTVRLGDAGLLVDALTNLVNNAKGLRSFTLEHLVLQGVQKDFDALESALMQHNNLKEFNMNDCIASNDGIDTDKIVKAGKNINTTSISDPAQVKSNAIAAWVQFHEWHATTGGSLFWVDSQVFILKFWRL